MRPGAGGCGQRGIALKGWVCEGTWEKRQILKQPGRKAVARGDQGQKRT